jgi:hypothetical protein
MSSEASELSSSSVQEAQFVGVSMASYMSNMRLQEQSQIKTPRILDDSSRRLKLPLPTAPIPPSTIETNLRTHMRRDATSNERGTGRVRSSMPNGASLRGRTFGGSGLQIPMPRHQSHLQARTSKVSTKVESSCSPQTTITRAPMLANID